MPTGDYYGGNRPGNTLFDESLVALDIKTGKRKWHYQTTHHGVWDYDLPCAPILFDIDDRTAGASRRWRSRPSRRSCSCSIARPASRSGRSRSGPFRSRRCRTRRPARRSRSRRSRRRSIGRASSIDDLIDFTPALRAEALEVVKRYQIGPLFTPPVLERPRRSARDDAAAGRHRRRELAGRRRSIRKRIASTSTRTPAVYTCGIVPANPATSDLGYVSGQARAAAPAARGAAAQAADPDAPRRRGAARGARGGRWRGRAAGGGAAARPCRACR